MADALSRLATGGGFSKRELYTVWGEAIIYVCRPVLLNGIPSLLARADLADRALPITLPHIMPQRRRTEADVWKEFYAAAPLILGALLDGLVLALRDGPTLEFTRLSRMADFYKIACAAAPAFGWTREAMQAAIEGSAEATVAAIVENDPIATAVRKIAALGGFEGNGTALLDRINAQFLEEVRRDKFWPKDAARLSAKLKRLAPALRSTGLDIELPTSGGRGGRVIVIPSTAPPHTSDHGSFAQPTEPYSTTYGAGNQSAMRLLPALQQAGMGEKGKPANDPEPPQGTSTQLPVRR